MELIKSKYYEPYDGWCDEGILEFHTLRSDLIQNITSWIVEQVIEFETWARGGKLVWIKVYGEDSSWLGVNTFRMKIVWRFYVPQSLGVVPMVDPSTIFLAIVAVIALIVLVFLVKEIRKVFESPGAQYIPWLIGGILGITLVIFLVPLLKKKGKT